MAIRSIRKIGDDLLRKKSREIEVVDDRIRQLLDDMYDTLKQTDDGVGLAAPQVGILKRAIVIDLTCEDGPIYKLINPVIVKRSGEQECTEGCLSVPGRLGKVIRPWQSRADILVSEKEENAKKEKEREELTSDKVEEKEDTNDDLSEKED